MKQLFLFDTPESVSDIKVHVPTHWKMFVDGASRNNPGPSGAGIYLLKDGQSHLKQGYFLGVKTNNQAEYLALILGLVLLDDYYKSGDFVRIVSDSKLMVHQIDGSYRVKKEELKPLHRLALSMVKRFNARLDHVLRADNHVADQMANHGVDKKVKISPATLELLQRHEIPM